MKSEPWSKISEDGKQLLTNLLAVSPKQRFTAEMVLQNRWITSTAPTTPLDKSVMKGIVALLES